MRWLVDVCYGLAVVATAPIWLPKMVRTGKHRTDWGGRFGRISAIPRDSTKQRVLIHAVSVGEVNAIRRLVEELTTNASTQLDVVLAVTTDTGLDRARSMFADRLHIVRYPLDFSRAVDRFLNAVQPDLVALVELEVWPNFVASCAARGIPVCVVNGRLTARSHGRYRLLGAAIRHTFARLALVAAQNEAYAERFRDLGAPPERVHITGTMKWDTAEIADSVESADDLAVELGINPDAPLVVAGSTAPPEHHLLHEATPEGVQLLCAPRRPEWFEHAARALPGSVRRSHVRRYVTAESSRSHEHRFVLDTIGELRGAYSLADVVVVGRTFTDLGGSDMMEPIALGKATIVGPFVSNFEDTVAALIEGEGLVQTDAEHLADVLRRLLNDARWRRSLGSNGRKVIRDHQGATKRTVDLIVELLHDSKSRSS